MYYIKRQVLFLIPKQFVKGKTEVGKYGEFQFQLQTVTLNGVLANVTV